MKYNELEARLRSLTRINSKSAKFRVNAIKDLMDVFKKRALNEYFSDEVLLSDCAHELYAEYKSDLATLTPALSKMRDEYICGMNELKSFYIDDKILTVPQIQEQLETLKLNNINEIKERLLSLNVLNRIRPSDLYEAFNLTQGEI